MNRRKKKGKAREKRRKARAAAKRLKRSESAELPRPSASRQATAHAESPGPTMGPTDGPVECERLNRVPTAEKAPAVEKNLADWRLRRRRIWLDFINGMLVAALLLGLKLILEDSRIVDRFRAMTYDLMQLRLASTSSGKNLPVAVVDISEIGLMDTDLPQRQATPREPLRHLLAIIAEQNPSAIGIDIDFSSDERGLMFRSDPEFFKYCLALRNPRKARIPVFLGVRRSEMLRPAQWLDSEDFQELAASIAVPNKVGKMVEAISVTSSTRQLPAMGAALAKAYRGQRPIAELPKWMFHRVSEGSPSPGVFHAPEFTVDFGPLGALEEQTHPVYATNTKPTIVFSPRLPLSGKIVLLGNAVREKAFDQFSVPGEPKPKPGVYLHACAAYTLVTKPLFELSFLGNLLLDLFLAMIAFSIIAFIRLYYYKKTPQEVATRPLEVVLLILLAGAILIGGIGFVHLTRIMWEDAVLVSIALLAHSSVADVISWSRRVIVAAWRAGVFQTNKESRS